MLISLIYIITMFSLLNILKLIFKE
jgi:hypothetical protein